MAEKITSQRDLRQWNTLLWALISIEGVIALIALLRIPSESESAIAFGFSLMRLAVISGTLSGIAITGLFAWAAWQQPAWWRRLSGVAKAFFSAELRSFGVFTFLFSMFFTVSVFLAMAAVLGPEHVGNLWPVYERMGFLMLWIILGAVQLCFIILLNIQSFSIKRIFTDRFYLAVLLTILTSIYAFTLRYYADLHWELRMRGLESYIFLPAIGFLVWGVCERAFQHQPWYEKAERIFLVLAVAMVTLAVYRHTAFWMGLVETPPKAYWALLSEAFLQGRLYLLNPPETHDLTLYNGEWYIPNPPLPAFLLIPWVALQGAENVNTVYFSIIIAVINVVLVYLILSKASVSGLIPTNKSANLWLTALFAFSTSHWWLSFGGRMWWVSQLLTLTFAALAVLAVLHRQTPLLAGLYLGAAVLARPNVFTLWPFLVGLFIYIYKQTQGVIQWRRVFHWMLLSAAPVCLAVAGLLYYNYIRFDDWLDFGYVTINGADWIMEAVRTYGMFNIHFVPTNFHAMFIRLPTFNSQMGAFFTPQDLKGRVYSP
jgi:hypothetical protein